MNNNSPTPNSGNLPVNGQIHHNSSDRETIPTISEFFETIEKENGKMGLEESLERIKAQGDFGKRESLYSSPENYAPLIKEKESLSKERENVVFKEFPDRILRTETVATKRIDRFDKLNAYGNWFYNNKKGLSALVLTLGLILLFWLALKFVVLVDFESENLPVGKKSSGFILENDKSANFDKTSEISEKTVVNNFPGIRSLFTGTIGGIPVHMEYLTTGKSDCSGEGSAFDGFYYYDQNGPTNKVRIKGYYCNDIIVFDEYFSSGKKAGHFSGIKGEVIEGRLISQGENLECIFN